MAVVKAVHNTSEFRRTGRFYPDEYAEIHHIAYACEKCGKLSVHNLQIVGDNSP
jgi:hypothetical protein